jgi:hypothetical protein
MPMSLSVTYERTYDGNEYTREGSNGRIYSGVIGWVYLVRVDGELVDDEDFKTVNEVKNRFPNAKRFDSVQQTPSKENQMSVAAQTIASAPSTATPDFLIPEVELNAPKDTYFARFSNGLIVSNHEKHKKLSFASLQLTKKGDLKLGWFESRLEAEDSCQKTCQWFEVVETVDSNTDEGWRDLFFAECNQSRFIASNAPEIDPQETAEKKLFTRIARINYQKTESCFQEYFENPFKSAFEKGLEKIKKEPVKVEEVKTEEKQISVNGYLQMNAIREGVDLEEQKKEAMFLAQMRLVEEFAKKQNLLVDEEGNLLIKLTIKNDKKKTTSKVDGTSALRRFWETLVSQEGGVSREDLITQAKEKFPDLSQGTFLKQMWYLRNGKDDKKTIWPEYKGRKAVEINGMFVWDVEPEQSSLPI